MVDAFSSQANELNAGCNGSSSHVFDSDSMTHTDERKGSFMSSIFSVGFQKSASIQSRTGPDKFAV